MKKKLLITCCLMAASLTYAEGAKLSSVAPLMASGAVSEQYAGTPWTGTPYTIPGTIEAENYDKGGEGIGYKWGTSDSGDRSYRTDSKGCQNGNGGTVIGFMDNGIWTKYTVNIEQDGDYTAEVLCSSGNEWGRFSFDLDDNPVSTEMKVANNGWGTYGITALKKIHLKAGKHVLTFHGDGMNCDKFTFKRTGEYTGVEGSADDLVYPMTKVCEGNPLFVNFPSPKWGSKQVGNFWSADPSARVWNIDGKDVLYVYCSHDMEPAQGCDHMDRYHIFSTEDMRTWTDHGEIFESNAVNKIMGSGWTVEGFMWAPDCLYNPNDKLYYYYFPHPKGPSWNDSWEIIVATSDRPDGGFTIKKAITGMPGCIDPNVFLDTDGQPYIYVGGGGEVWGGKLKKDDWTTVDGKMTKMTINNGHFHEGAWVFKKDGVYFLTYPGNGGAAGDKMLYATSNKPMGPWTEQGAYMYPHGGNTAHGSVVEFKGKWYQFYHTGNYSGSDVLRSVCVDELTFDGNKINMVRNWGEPYGELPSASLKKTVKVEAEHYNTGGSHYGYFKRPENDDINTETADGATFISELTGGEWVRYSVNIEEDGPYGIKLRMKQKNGSGKFNIGVDGSYVRTNVEVGPDINKWIEISLDNMFIEKGEHYIELRGVSGDMQIDWFEIGSGYTKIPGTVEAEDFDRGGEGVAYHWVNKNANGYGYRDDANFIESGQGLGWIDDGSWCNYTVNVTKAGRYKLTYYTASGNNGGSFRLYWDGKDLCGELTCKGTGGWTNWQPNVCSKEFTLTKGQHTLQFRAGGGMNVDKFVFECTWEDPTGISDIKADESKEGKWYRLDGSQSKTPQRGVNIHNGKKIIIK